LLIEVFIWGVCMFDGFDIVRLLLGFFLLYFFIVFPAHIIFESVLLLRALRSKRFEVKSRDAVGSWLITSISMLFPLLFIIFFLEEGYLVIFAILFFALNLIGPFIVRLNSITDSRFVDSSNDGLAGEVFRYTLLNVIGMGISVTYMLILVRAENYILYLLVLFVFSIPSYHNEGRIQEALRIMLTHDFINNVYWGAGFVIIRRESILYKLRILMVYGFFIAIASFPLILIPNNESFFDSIAGWGAMNYSFEIFISALVYSLAYYFFKRRFESSDWSGWESYSNLKEAVE